MSLNAPDSWAIKEEIILRFNVLLAYEAKQEDASIQAKVVYYSFLDKLTRCGWVLLSDRPKSRQGYIFYTCTGILHVSVNLDKIIPCILCKLTIFSYHSCLPYCSGAEIFRQLFRCTHLEPCQLWLVERYGQGLRF